MNIGILGSGMVAQAIGGKLAELGHAVKLGTRSPEKLAAWLAQTGPRATAGSFAEAAAFAERFIVNAGNGAAALEILRAAGEANLNGKILLDVANPLDFSRGMPPSLTVCNTDSLGEQIQRAFPKVHVVKTLNTLTAPLMVNPGLLPEDTAVFVGGNEAGAKAEVTALLREGFGWRTVIDLGDITSARGTEMVLPLWVRLYGGFGSAMFNFKIVRQ